jgi:hypothetical protein
MPPISTAQPPSPIAPRWAGYVAAAMGLEYTVTKVIMAARGRLGALGHPAPAQRTDHFTGNIVVAQLGNAAIGLLTVLVALACVQRWGRRIPPIVLTAGAAANLLGVFAGTAIVLTSLAGLRQDHGQWGIDSLLLGAPPMAAWLALTGAAARAARAAGLPAPLRALRDRRPVLPRPGHRAALAAATGCGAYGVLKLSWALGGELLMRQAPLPAHAIRDMLDRDSGAVAGHWATVALAVVGVALALATTRRRLLPRPLTVWLPALLAILMLARAAYLATGDVAVLTGIVGGSRYTCAWDLALWSPFFTLWGASWGLTARAAHRRHGSDPQPHRLARPALTVGSATSAWGIVFAIVHAYWAAGGAIGMNGDPAHTPGAQIYIGGVTLVGLLSALVAARLDRDHRAAWRGAPLRTLARIGGAALLLGVAVGSARWVADGSLDGDGAGGVVITAYFLAGGVLFSVLGRRARPSTQRSPLLRSR